MTRETVRTAGMVVLRASRLEALVAPLQTMLEAMRPQDPLAGQSVIAAHPGMRQWLVGALARHLGPERIVANLDVQLASTWLDGLARRCLGEQAVALPHYRRAGLRWSLHAVLDDECLPAGVDDERIRRYLQPVAGSCPAGELARRRFQLADRLAAIFTQYLVYRRDWLAAWEAGRNDVATGERDDRAWVELEARLLAPLWRSVQARLGVHRGGLMRELVQALQGRQAALEPIHVFGVSHLPPAELDILRAYARQAPVLFYVPDPCREYWVGLIAPSHARAGFARADQPAWQRYRQDEAERIELGEEGNWEQGHPLLSHWGRLGQHFLAALAAEELIEDQRHWQDREDVEPLNRLQRLQESIRRLEPDLMWEDTQARAAREDASLLVHVCHTRLRELEVLRTAMLDALGQGIQPGEMVVMAPSIGAYAPLVAAVFGEAGSASASHLPYHLADVAVTRGHAIFDLLNALLGMSASRVDAAQVVDLLKLAEVQRALGIAGNDVDSLVGWLRESHVAWALNGAHKADFGVPASSANSFAWALDRLLAGYVMAEHAGDAPGVAVVLPDGTRLLPLPGVEGPEVVALGGLHDLLCELAQWRALGQQTHPASRWRLMLQERIDALVRIDPDDRDARAALTALHRIIGNLAAEPAHNGEDPVLHFAVVRDLLRDALASVPERQRFLMGGVTFCGMVPQRAIPFRLVCVLGLDEGEFPRRRSDGGLDLMVHKRRVGDRDTIGDDRYLFLEMLMSARERLHLSYIGQSVHDGKRRNPAAPLAELLAELDRACGNGSEARDEQRPWAVLHPLQPFDPRYFDGSDPRLFSHVQEYAQLPRNGGSVMPGFKPKGERWPLPPWPDVLALRSLTAYFKDPAREILRDRLQLSLASLEAERALPESEPLDGIERIHALARTLFFAHALPAMLGADDWDAGTPPAWVGLSGILPIGPAGQAAWEAEAQAARDAADAAVSMGRFDSASLQDSRDVAVSVAIPVEAAGHIVRIEGSVAQVYGLAGEPGGLQLVRVFPSARESKAPRLRKGADLHFGELVPAFLDWALLRLQVDSELSGGKRPPRVLLTLITNGDVALAAGIERWDREYAAADDGRQELMRTDLHRRVAGLAALWQRAADGSVAYYPRTAFKAYQVSEWDANGRLSDLEQVAAKARGAWHSDWGEGSGERDHAPGYAAYLEGDLWFGDREHDPDNTGLQELLAVAQELNALISLDALQAEVAP